MTFVPSYQSSTSPRSGFDDQITWKTKSCQTPRTSGVLHSVTMGLRTLLSSATVSPWMSNSIGGEPQQPLWCHWVKTCHELALGYEESNIVLHA